MCTGGVHCACTVVSTARLRLSQASPIPPPSLLPLHLPLASPFPYHFLTPYALLNKWHV